MSKLLSKADLNYWLNKDNYGPFIKVNPKLKSDLEGICKAKEETILALFAARAYINQPNNENIGHHHATKRFIWN